MAAKIVAPPRAAITDISEELFANDALHHLPITPERLPSADHPGGRPPCGLARPYLPDVSYKRYKTEFVCSLCQASSRLSSPALLTPPKGLCPTLWTKPFSIPRHRGFKTAAFAKRECFAPQVGGANSVKETPQPVRGFIVPQRHWGLVVRQVQLCNPLASLDMIPRSSPVSFSRTH